MYYTMQEVSDRKTQTSTGRMAPPPVRRYLLHLPPHRAGDN